MVDVGARLRKLRRDKGLSQSDLASQAVSASYISLIESGKRMPSSDVIRYLAAKLACDPSELTGSPSVSREFRAKSDLTFAELAMSQGDWPGALTALSGIGTEGLSEDLRYQVLFALGRAHEAVGDLESAVTTLAPLYHLARQENRLLRVFETATFLVSCYIESADLLEACRLGREAMDAPSSSELTCSDEYARLLATTSWAMYEQGDYLAARDLIHAALPRIEGAGSPRARGSLYWNASLIALGRGELANAQDLASRALALISEHSSQRDMARLRVHYSHILLCGPTPLPEEALRQAQHAERDLRQIASMIDVADCLTEASRALFALGRFDEAREKAEASLQCLAQEVEGGTDGEPVPAAPRLEAVEARIALASSQDALGLFDLAVGNYRAAASTLSLLRLGRRSAAVWRELADCLNARGNTEEAMAAYVEALNALGVAEMRSHLAAGSRKEP